MQVYFVVEVHVRLFAAGADVFFATFMNSFGACVVVGEGGGRACACVYGGKGCIHVMNV